MIRNLKALGLALAAVFAFGAFAASAASAYEGVLTSDGPVTLVGEEEGGVGENALTAFGGAVECEGSIYTGHQVITLEETEKGVKHTFITPPVSRFTVTPHYNQENCVSKLGGSEFSSTVDMTSCDYEFTLTETAKDAENNPIPDTYEVDAYVICDEPGDMIDVDAFAGSSHGFRVCHTTVGAQGPLQGAHATDNTDGTVTLSGTITGISSSKSGLCGAESTTEGEFDLNVGVGGIEEEGEPTGIGISHTAE